MTTKTYSGATTMNALEKGSFSRHTAASWPSPPPPIEMGWAASVAFDDHLLTVGPGAGGLVAESYGISAEDVAVICPQEPLGGLSKRVLVVIVAAAALMLASPVMLAAVLLIRLTTGQPALFRHSRVGFGGKQFECFKFRSMVANADEALRQHLARNPEAAEEWKRSRKLRRDPRVTLLGQMLRKSSIDELPQLFNILRGEMSCVGPRPVVADELARYGEHVGDYLQTRPGLTGLWQVTARDSADYEFRVALDSQYVRNWSLWSDLVILARTVFAGMRFDRAS